MSKAGIPSRKFDQVIRGLLAVPKKAIQQEIEKDLIEKKKRTAKKALKKERLGG